MSSKKFYIKRGDTKPDLVLVLRRGDGTYPDLTAAQAVFRMTKKSSRTRKVDRAMTLNDAQHMVRLAWQLTDTDEEGQFVGEVEVTYLADNSKETFPTNGYINIEVTSDL